VAPVQHRPVRHRAKRAPAHRKVHKKAHKTAAPQPPRQQPVKPLLAAGPPIATSSGSSSPALLIIAFGLAAALAGAALAFVPASAVPFRLALRFEQNRLTILIAGLAIGVACTLVGFLTILADR
jgi:hypothetical protein